MVSSMCAMFVAPTHLFHLGYRNLFTFGLEPGITDIVIIRPNGKKCTPKYRVTRVTRSWMSVWSWNSCEALMLWSWSNGTNCRGGRPISNAQDCLLAVDFRSNQFNLYFWNNEFRSVEAISHYIKKLKNAQWHIDKLVQPLQVSRFEVLEVYFWHFEGFFGQAKEAEYTVKPYQNWDIIMWGFFWKLEIHILI